MTSNNTYGSHYSKGRQSSTLQVLVDGDPQPHFVSSQQNVAQRNRHGLFTQPMGLSLGDTYHQNKPQPFPKNVTINKRLVQRVGPQLFQKVPSIHINDLYKDGFRANQLYIKEKAELSLHQNALKAGGKARTIRHSQFEHIKEYDDKVYGKGESAKNITTNNMRRGYGNTTYGHLFSAPKYIPSPYDAPKDITLKEKIEHRAKIPKPFVGGGRTTDTFTPIYQAVSTSHPYQPPKDDTLYRGKGGKSMLTNPNKKGFYGTFTEFPKHIEEGEKVRVVKHEPIWRPNFNGTSKGFGETLARPSPAPSQLVLNEIRRSK